MSENILLAISLLLQVTEQAAKIGGLIQRAQAEGRDPTVEELAELKSADDTARDRLAAAIAAAEAGG